jgi:hypothetical protein
VSNRTGQAYAFMAITPILEGMAPALRAQLERLSQGESPFARLPRTHFARWVILPDWINDRSQPERDQLRSEYLIFTSNFDGERDSYLDELGERLAPEAEEIWGNCAGCPSPASGAALKAYLLHNQINTGFFVAAYPRATVEQVRRSLGLRTRLIDFALGAQGMEPAQLQQAFDAEFRR